MNQYFIRLKTHCLMHSGPPIPESDLEEEIRKRGWNRQEVVCDIANLSFYNECLRSFYDKKRNV